MPVTRVVRARVSSDQIAVWRGPASVIAMWLIACLPYLAGRRFIPFDSIAAFYPLSHFVVSSLVHGLAPWWNPYMFGGQPLLADPQSMIFTPHTVVGFLAGGAYNLHVFDSTTLGCLLIGGLAMHRYGVAMADHWLLPVLGAAVFMFGGVATSRLQHVTEIVSYSWLPIELLLLRSVALSGRISWAIALTAVFTLTLLNANQVLFLSVFGLAPLALLHCARSPRRARAVCLIACAAVAALILASPLLAATNEFLRLSNRPSLPLSASDAASLPFHVLASLFLPGLYGADGPLQAIWTPTDVTQDYLYIGVLPCSVLVLSAARFRSMSLESKLCLVLMIVWFVFSMGTRTPFYRLLFLHVPGFAAFRRPADGEFLLNFSIAVFVAQASLSGLRLRLGVSILAAFIAIALFAFAIAQVSAFAGRSGHLRALIYCVETTVFRMVIVAALLCLSVYARRWFAKERVGSFTGLGLLAAAFADLCSAGRFGQIYAPRTPSFEDAMLYSGGPHATHSDNATGKTIAFLQSQQALASEPGWRMEALGGNLAGAMPMAFQLATTAGYDPVLSARYAQLIGSQDLQTKPKSFTSAAPDYDSAPYRRLGLRFVLLHRTILRQPAEFGAFGVVSTRLRQQLETGGYAQLADEAGEYEIWELHNALPRAVLLPTDAIPGTAAQPPGSCSIVSYAPTELRVHCRSDKEAQLVVGDNAAPGWSACVNGAQAEISVFEGLFRAVPVPAGESETQFRYQPLPFFRSRACLA